MNGMRKAWIGLYGILAMASANAADLAIEAPSGTAGGKTLVFATAQKVGTESASAMDVKLTASGGTVTFDVIGIESPNFTLLPPATPPVAGDCGATLAAAASCTLHVKFTPTAAGTRYAELTIRSDAVSAVNGLQTVYLQGTGIGKASQAITFGAAPTIAVGGTGTVTATADSGLPVTFSSTTTGVCTLSGSTVTGVAAGTCTIAADQAGNADYNAATQVTQNIAIGKGSQTIGAISGPTSIAMNATGTVSATATSGLAVVITSTTPATCTVAGSTVAPVSIGACTIAANQPGDSNYNAATQVTKSISIVAAKTDQTITFGAAPTVTVGATGTVSATATSGLAVTFSSTTPSVCTVSGSTVTGVTTGSCIIAANQGGDATYNPAPQATQTITVGAAVAGGGGLCDQYGITNNIELALSGNTSKALTIRTTESYSFSFTTGALGTAGQLKTNYSTTPSQYVSVSKSKCDYAATLEPLCAKQAATPVLYYKAGGTSSFQCILEPNTTYYFNVRDATRDATTKAFTNNCSGSCTFMTF